MFHRSIRISLLCSLTWALDLTGVAPENEQLYKVAKLVCPGNPEKTLTEAMINDGFCDCPEDGFDEPGTSACNNGAFYCHNKGFLPKTVDSIFVNDGVCDCCDGSDEAGNPKVKCPNTCGALKKEHDRLEAEKAAALKSAEEEKARLRAKAVAIRADHERKIKIARLELEAIERQTKLIQSVGNGKIEEPETAPVDPFQQHCMDLQSKFEKVKNIFETMRDASDKCKPCLKALESFDRLETGKPEPFNVGNMLFDELLQDGEIGEAKEKSIWDYLKRLNFGELRSMIKRYRVTTTVTVVIPQPTAAITVDPTAELEKKIRKIKTDLETLEKQYDKDYGADDIFLSYQGECYESIRDKYKYKICPFQKVTQAETAQAFNHETDLGDWDSWGKNADGSTDYNEMHYTGGLQCWSGPQRSTHVILECGPKTEILDVSEPSTCAYVMRVACPAVC